MILVVGATGNVGGAVAQMLLAEGQSVRVLARPGSNVKHLVEAGAEVALGDLKQPASLASACQGADIVITTATSASRGGDDTVQTVDLDGNRHLIEAAQAAGARQFIFVSFFGADANSPIPISQAKAKTENVLRTSGMPYTIIAPDFYMEVTLVGFVGMPAIQGQPVTIVGGGRRKHAWVSARDVAALIVAAVDKPAAINQQLVLGGPEPLSFLDAVAIYERVLGRPVPVRHVAPGETIPGLPAPVGQLLAALDAYDSPIDTSETANVFGIRLTSLEEVAARSAAHAIAA
jgi:uncharacterized protein YbjT (DUF2867 family)